MFVGFRNESVGFIAGNQGTLLLTIDGGVTWNSINIATTNNLSSLSVTSNFAYLLTSDGSYGNDSLFKTNDNINWVRSKFDASFVDITKAYFQNDSTGFIIDAYCCTCPVPCAVNILKSSDYGETWTCSLQSGAPSSISWSSPHIVFSSDSFGYVLYGNNIIKTNNGGTACTLLSTQELNDDDFLEVFPNPSNGKFSIQINDGLPSFTTNQLSIFNVFGECVYQQVETSPNLLIDLSAVPDGIYFLRVITPAGVAVRKVIKN